MQNMSGAMDHLKNHQSYPASKEDLVKECENLSDFSKEDKEWFEEHLADKIYTSADDVMKVLGWGKEDMEQPYQTV